MISEHSAHNSRPGAFEYLQHQKIYKIKDDCSKKYSISHREIMVENVIELHSYRPHNKINHSTITQVFILVSF